MKEVVLRHIFVVVLRVVFAFRNDVRVLVLRDLHLLETLPEHFRGDTVNHAISGCGCWMSTVRVELD